jgi:hypothetical protein
MPGRVTLKVVAGPLEGRAFVSERHDLLLFGRAEDCNARLPEDDTGVSRQHFLVEVNPPDVMVRDLGSKHGTVLNGRRLGGRKAKSEDIAADLKDGDRIEAGHAAFVVQIEPPCVECGKVIARDELDDNPVCAACREKGAKKASKPPPLKCRACGNDVTAEVGARRGAYFCAACRAKAASTPGELARMAGAGLSEFEVVKPLGAGPWGEVYEAKRKKDGKRVALKLVVARTPVDASARDAFLKAAGEAKKIEHDNIAAVYDVGSAGPVFYVASELAPKGTALDLLKRKGLLPAKDAGAIVLQALKGLEHAHQAGVVHGALKPSNVVLCEAGGKAVAKIADIGIGRALEAAGLSGFLVSRTDAGARFLARERLLGLREVAPSADLWGAAAVLYHLMTKAYPHDETEERDWVEVLLRDEPVPLAKRDASVPRKVAEAVDRAFTREGRYGSAAEMRGALGTAILAASEREKRS